MAKLSSTIDERLDWLRSHPEVMRLPEREVFKWMKKAGLYAPTSNWCDCNVQTLLKSLRPKGKQMNTEETQELTVQSSSNLLLMPVMNVELALHRLHEFQTFVKSYLVKDEDFGVIPGTPKPTLLKPGADKLCELYGLADTYEITNRVEDWVLNLFDYEVRCTLISKRDGMTAATGLGSCNSWEGKYRWRQADRKCPECGKPTIMKSKEEFGGGWFCFAKKGGCGRKFKAGDQAIEGQKLGRVENDDIPTLKNTILKMAKKRAKIDATLGATRSSGIFTQDIEDFPTNGGPEPVAEKPEPPAAQPAPNGGTTQKSFELTELDLARQALSNLMAHPVFSDTDRAMAHKWLGKNPSLEAVKKKLQEKKGLIPENENPDADRPPVAEGQAF